MENLRPYLEGETRKFNANPAYADTIKNVANKPGWIAKEINRPVYKKREKFEERLKHLENNFKDFLPEHNMAYGGRSAENSTLYMFMEEVKSRFTDRESEQKFIYDLQNLICKVLEVYIEGYNSETKKGPFFDLQPANIKFGKTVSNEEEKLYIIDLYPPFIELDADEVGNLTRSFISDYPNSYEFPEVEKLLKKLMEIKK